MEDQREIALLLTIYCKKKPVYVICIGFCHDIAQDLTSGHHITSPWATAYKNKH